MKKVFLIPLMIALVSALIFGSRPAPAPAQVKPIKLKFAHHIPPKGVAPTVLREWGKKIEKDTNGRVKITFYPAESLVKMADFYEACVGGVCDMTYGAHPQDPSRFRLGTVTDLPALNFPSDEVRIRIMNELVEKFPEMRAERKEVKTLFLNNLPAEILHFTKKVVRTPADMKGTKMRAMGPAVLVMESLGAVSVSIHISDTYMGLDRGAVEGLPLPWVVLHTQKFHELTTTHTKVPLTTVSMMAIMNKEKWDSLPPDIQKVIDDASVWAAHETAGRLRIRGDKARKLCMERGDTFVTPTPEEMKLWRDALKPVWEKWIEEREAEGLPGRAVLNETLRLIEQYSK